MSLYEYQESKEIQNYGFYSLIMAAMRNADDKNLHKLRYEWPEIYEEFKEIYNAPGGVINSDK